MNYVCVENNQVTAVLNYRPNVPGTVTVIEVSDQQNDLINAGTHFFNTATNTVEPLSAEQLAEKNTYDQNGVHREFLNRTDWKILRHIREKALNVPTTLSEQEYIDLETAREEAANSITQ